MGKTINSTKRLRPEKRQFRPKIIMIRTSIPKLFQFVCYLFYFGEINLDSVISRVVFTNLRIIRQVISLSKNSHYFAFLD